MSGAQHRREIPPQLPHEERAALAASLLDSLDADIDEDAEAAWAMEVNQPLTDLDSGAVKTFPGQRSAADSPRADSAVRRRMGPAFRDVT